MDTLLYAALSNAAVAVALAPIIGLFGRFSRRPALVHSLWLVLFVKMLTPPLWPVAVSWPTDSEEALFATDLAIDQPSQQAAPMDTLSPRSPAVKGTDAAAEESPTSATARDALGNRGIPVQRSIPAAEPLPAPEKPSPPARAAPFTISWQSWLLTVWLSGSTLWLALACYRLCRFHRLLRLTEPVPENLQSRADSLAKRLGLARCPGVWVLSAPVSPMLWAFLGEPRLLVPASLLGRLSEEQWDTLLAHELAHLRRRDHWVRLLELAVLGLYWWHPVIWWARRRLRETEEQSSDAWVVWALPGTAELYARTLVDALTYLSGARSVLPLAASGIGQMNLLKRRLTMIMRGTTPRAVSVTGSLAVLGLAAVLLPLYPTLARTGQGPITAEAQQAPGAAAEIDTRTVPAAGATAGFLEADGDSQMVQPSTGRARYLSESLEDAKDDVDLLRVQLEVKQAERREVEALLNQAQSDLQKYQNLVSNHAISEGVLDKARSEVVALKARRAIKDAQLKEAELRLKQAERRLARLRSRLMPAPAKPSAPSAGRPRGSAIPPPQGGGVGAGRGFGGGFGGGTSFNGGIPAGNEKSFSGGISAGSGNSFSGGISGAIKAPLGGISGMGAVRGNPSSYEHRLAEVEKKLQSLTEEIKALRRERRGEKPESDKN